MILCRLVMLAMSADLSFGDVLSSKEDSVLQTLDWKTPLGMTERNTNGVKNNEVNLYLVSGTHDQCWVGRKR